jgi:glyoxylase-like metal-dependent hydrolase (beta-lactamase superfamily II)
MALGNTHHHPDHTYGNGNVSFETSLTLQLDKSFVELRHTGPAHTTNDVFVWLPEQRVLFAGDLALAGASRSLSRDQCVPSGLLCKPCERSSPRSWCRVTGPSYAART